MKRFQHSRSRGLADRATALAVMAIVVAPRLTAGHAVAAEPTSASVHAAVTVSQAVYDCTESRCAPGTGLPDGYCLIVAPTTDAGSGFQAAGYQDESTGTVYIAVAGTSLSSADILADRSFLLTEPEAGEMRIQTILAADMVVREVEAARSAPRAGCARKPTQVVVTGHSLGGAIAQYVAASKGLPAITFNSPPLPPGLLAQLPGGSGKGITNYLRSNDWVVALATHSGSDYLGVVRTCPSAALTAHRIADFVTFERSSPNLGTCPDARQPSRGIWTEYQEAYNRIWAKYNQDYNALWASYRGSGAGASSQALQAEIGRLTGTRDADLLQIVKRRESMLREVLADRDSGLAILMQRRDQANLQAIALRDSRLGMLLRQRDQALRGTNSPVTRALIWHDYNANYNRAWREYNEQYGAAWDAYNLGYDSIWAFYNARLQ